MQDSSGREVARLLKDALRKVKSAEDDADTASRAAARNDCAGAKQYASSASDDAHSAAKLIEQAIRRI
jgi:hypothetical protein